MKEKIIAIAALARNCEINLPDNLRRMEELGGYFKEAYYFVYENNSTDSTKDIIRSWNARTMNSYIMVEDLVDTVKKEDVNIGKMYKGTTLARMERMCSCRNKLLNMIKENCNPDYIVFVDSDVLSFSVEGIIVAIQNAPEGWGGLFANCYTKYEYKGKQYNIPLYYDTYPFISKGRDPLSVTYKEFHLIRRFLLGRHLYKAVRKQKYYECVSGFGGIGIYQYSSIKDYKYDIFVSKEMKPTGLCMCDHVFLNTQIKEAKYIAKDIEVCYEIYKKEGVRGWFFSKMPLMCNLIIYLLRYIK